MRADFELASIAFMEANRVEASLIVVRSQKGEELVRRATDHRVLELDSMPTTRIVEAMGMEELMREERARKLILKLLGRISPTYRSSPYRRAAVHATYIAVLGALHFILSNSLSTGIQDSLVSSWVSTWVCGISSGF